jgi:ABC-2 type transport system ATP-binding protein
MTPTIEAVGLRKRFGKTVALDGLDLVAEPGQVLAVLGPNGAGKTTFVRTVATLLRPDAGELRVAGHDVRRQAGRCAGRSAWPASTPRSSPR